MLPADPTLSVAERVDAVCDRFEFEWKAGLKPQVDDFLAAAPQSDREELHRSLIALEVELQGRSGAETSVGQSSVRTGDKPTPVITVDHTRSVEPSTRTVGRFEIRGVLGSGAFGKVYRAFDPHLGREVAVKVPLDPSIRTDAERNRFLKEARLAATINHPNVCQVHEVGEADGLPYIVMALVRGQSLAQMLKARKKPLAQKQAALIVRKIALALAAAHDSGIVHRDLKPANVMFDRERKEIVLMDFGLAGGQRLGDARGIQSGVIVGTPSYMSPEQARGDSKGIGPSGDVFSLGVILYELLAGVRPFTGTATEVIGQILHVEPEAPSRHRPEIDPRLEAACLKALIKDPAARFTTMKEFAAVVDAVLRAPGPADPAAETARAFTTRRVEDQSTSTGNNLAGVFAAFSDDPKQAQTETAAAVEAAIANQRNRPWAFLLFGLLVAAGMAALAGVVFFTRSANVKVDLTVMINDLDLKDHSLGFFLDDESIAAEVLARPVELMPGVHIFTAKRSKEIVKRLEIRVEGGKTPGIQVEDMTPKVSPPPVERKGSPKLKPSPLDRLKAEDIPDRLMAKVFGEPKNVPKELVATYDSIVIDPKDLNENFFGGFSLDPAGGTLASGRYPYTIVELHNLATGRKSNTVALEPGGWVEWIRIAPDNQSIYYQRRSGKLVGAGIGGRIHWEQPVRAENFSVPALSPDGTTLVAAARDLKENALNVFDAETGAIRATWRGFIDKPMCRLAFSPNGQTLAVQSGDKTTFVSARDGTVLPVIPVEQMSGEPRFGPDGKRIYYSVSWRQTEDYCVEVDLASGIRREFRQSPNGCRDIIPNPEFPILATSDSASHLHFWDTKLGPNQQPYVISTGAKIERMLFTPEGRYLVVGAHNLIMIFRLPVERSVSEWAKPS